MGTIGNDVITVSQTGAYFNVVNNGVASTVPFDSTLEIYGLAGNDIVTVDAGVTAPVQLDGGLGNDTLFGGSGNEILFGGVGLDGRVGRGGNDTYVFEEPGLFESDKIDERENQGVDTVDFSAMINKVRVDLTQAITPMSMYHRHVGPGFRGAFAFLENVIGGTEGDFITGNNANNTLEGGAGNDVLIGGPGSDNLIGGTGDDRYRFNDTQIAERDVITELEDEGFDMIDFSQMYTPVLVDIPRNVAWHQNRHIPGIQFIESAWGGSGDDYMIAGATAVRFTGGWGNDTLVGGDGDDQLSGGRGNDLLLGRGGSDTIIFGDGSNKWYDRHDGTAEDVLIP